METSDFGQNHQKCKGVSQGKLLWWCGCVLESNHNQIYPSEYLNMFPEYRVKSATLLLGSTPSIWTEAKELTAQVNWNDLATLLGSRILSAKMETSDFLENFCDGVVVCLNQILTKFIQESTSRCLQNTEQNQPLCILHAPGVQHTFALEA